jgi:diguanylate cyclase (GGDEF)-like protein
MLLHTDERCEALAAELGVEQVGVAPLIGSSRCIGAVLLARAAGTPAFDPFTQDLVRTLAVQAGLALERVRDRESLREESLHDELTTLGNRRKARARLSTLQPGDALVALDLDDFKHVNDTRGHAAGDQVLRALGTFLSKAMAESIRDSDEAFRMGGEEFLLVLDQAHEGAELAVERLCNSWEQLDALTTFSAGIALHVSGTAPDVTLDRADAAL